MISSGKPFDRLRTSLAKVVFRGVLALSDNLRKADLEILYQELV